ncbi:22047_t:CDS:1, partial [Entrophospora sp. SA101]
HITAFSVIYQVMEEDPWIQQEILRNIVNNAVTLAINNYSRDISAQNKLYTIPV